MELRVLSALFRVPLAQSGQKLEFWTKPEYFKKG